MKLNKRNHALGDRSGKICGILRNLVPSVQSKKLEKHPWKSDTFSKVASFSFFDPLNASVAVI